MATAILKTAEDQITCTICFDIFKEPKALPCLHTFCRECIEKYIIERSSQYRHENGYPCPICRRHVSIPARFKHNPQVWAEQLENNHFVSTMIDAYEIQRGATMKLCADHPEKKLDFFCGDHSQFICSLCCPNHQHCSGVMSRKEASNDVNSSNKPNPITALKQNDMQQHICHLVDQCNLIEHVIDERRVAMELLDQSEQHVRDEVIYMRKRIHELVNKQKQAGNEPSIGSSEVLKQAGMNSPERLQVQEITLPFQGKPSWITGITILPSGKLLLIDHTNEALSVFSLSLDFLCKTRITPAPYDVVSISMTTDHVMVSFPDTRELVKCTVLPNGSVEKGQKLKTNIECKAITSDDRYVAVCSNSELQIFETDYAVWMILLDESYETTKFTYITMMSTERKVFITDKSYTEPNIRCIAFDGATLWKVTDERISFCTGICVASTQLMVTSWESGKVFTLSFNGDNLRTYSNATAVSPWKLHVSEREKIICVSQHKNTISEEDKRTIKVFKMI